MRGLVLKELVRISEDTQTLLNLWIDEEQKRMSDAGYPYVISPDGAIRRLIALDNIGRHKPNGQHTA